MKIVLAGGGTAGHIEPALAVAREWAKSHPNSEFIFLGTKGGLEESLVPNSGYKLSLITKVRIPRKVSFSLLKVPQTFMAAFSECRQIIQGAQLLVGFGGYVSGPAYIAAKSLRVPIVIHEANAKPGMANKFGALFTKYLAIAQAVDGGAFSGALLTGLPLRRDVQDAFLKAKTDWKKARATAKSEIGFSPELPVILITGGSQGSVAINQTILASLPDFESKRVQILHSVGARNALPESSHFYKPTTYISDMASAYLAADLVIARSGAVTCSEVQALGKYALFIPLPIGNGEQEVNAKSLIQAGRAEVISQKSFSTNWLTNNLDRLLTISAAQPDEGSDADLAAAQKIVALMELAIDEHRL